MQDMINERHSVGSSRDLLPWVDCWNVGFKPMNCLADFFPMCVVESLNMTDIVAMLRRMLQSRASSGDVASVGACESELRGYCYTQSAK